MNWHQLGSFFKHWRKADTIYDIHSPFLYEFIRFVFDKERTYYDFTLLRKIRESMEKDTGILPLSTYGAGNDFKKEALSIKKILSNIVSRRSVSEELYRMNLFLETTHCLEVGSCIGMNSLYMARSAKGKLVTLEGHAPFIEYAQQLFKVTQTSNIQLKAGEFVPSIRELSGEFDLIYLDGHHEYQATLEMADLLYPHLSKKGVLVVADIYWSLGMEKAWADLCRQERFGLSLDRFLYGILWKEGYKGVKRNVVFTPYSWTKPWKLHKAI